MAIFYVAYALSIALFGLAISAFVSGETVTGAILLVMSIAEFIVVRQIKERQTDER